MKLDKIKRQATALNLRQLAQIKGGTNDASTSPIIIIGDVDVY